MHGFGFLEFLLIPWAFRVFRVWMVLRYVWDVEVVCCIPRRIHLLQNLTGMLSLIQESRASSVISELQR